MTTKRIMTTNIIAKRGRPIFYWKLTFSTRIAFKTTFTMTFAFNATAMTRAARHLTFASWYFTFGPFVALLAVA